MEEPKEIPMFDSELPDLGFSIEFVPLADIDTTFNGDYLPSQEFEHRGLSSQEDHTFGEDYESENENPGGLEEILWPPELLL